MAWFRRNKVQQNTIPELQEYYNAERRERSGLSWLLAIVSVACAALLLIGLVFGGKWLYRKLAHNMDKDKTATTQTENNPNNQPATPAETSPTETTPSSDGSAAQTPTASSTPAATTPAASSSTPASTPAASTPSTTPATSTPSATPATASTQVATSDSGLPHTGPTGILAIIVSTVLLATAVRYTIFRYKFLK